MSRLCVMLAATLFAWPSAAAPARGSVRSRSVDPGPGAVADATAGRIEIESSNIAFGEYHGDVPREYPSAIIVRVYSGRTWALRLIPASPMAAEAGTTVSWNSMQWRSRGGKYLTLMPQGVIVARGSTTGAGGQVVAIDLRLAFGDTDALGRYGCLLQVVLDAF